MAAGRSAHPPRYPSTIAAVSPSIKVGGVVVRLARRDDVQAVSTDAVLGERELERLFLQGQPRRAHLAT